MILQILTQMQGDIHTLFDPTWLGSRPMWPGSSLTWTV